MRIINGQVFDLEQGFLSRDVLTDGGQIASASGDDRILDAAGCYVIPGLVDVHFHGCVGEDFSDATPDGLQKIADFELSQGVAYLCPAGMTLPEDQLTAICKNTAAHRAKHSGGAEVVGAHLEGPFLCMAKKGAQNGDYLHDPDTAMLKRLQAAAEGCVRLVTLAPEQPNSIEFIKAAVEMGVTVSVGHTTADYNTARAAFEAGASHATHLFNAMPPLAHRDPGVIGAAFDVPHVQPELICDGIHVHGSAVRAAFRYARRGIPLRRTDDRGPRQPGHHSGPPGDTGRVGHQPDGLPAPGCVLRHSSGRRGAGLHLQPRPVHRHRRPGRHPGRGQGGQHRPAG